MHDENTCVRSLSKVCRIDGNTIKARKDAVIGIKRLGMIDYLTKYRGYVFIYDNSAKVVFNSSNRSNINKENVKRAREARKEAKTPKLKNKKK